MAELGHWFEERYVISRRPDQVADDAARGPAPEANGGGPRSASADESGSSAPVDETNDNNT
jgi:hypothetical protein